MDLEMIILNRLRYIKCQKICDALFTLPVDNNFQKYCMLLIYSLSDEDINELYESKSLLENLMKK